MEEEKCFQFEFTGTIGGYGFVYANTEEEARERILKNDVDEIMDTWDMDIKEITNIKESK